jgi:hypothetical protein
MPGPGNHTLKTVFGSSAGTGKNVGGDFSVPGEKALTSAAGATTSMPLGDLLGDMSQLAIKTPTVRPAVSDNQAE